MLAEIYLLQLELAAQASEQAAAKKKKQYDFVPFSLEAFASEKRGRPGSRSKATPLKNTGGTAQSSTQK